MVYDKLATNVTSWFFTQSARSPYFPINVHKHSFTKCLYTYIFNMYVYIYKDSKEEFNWHFSHMVWTESSVGHIQSGAGRGETRSQCTMCRWLGLSRWWSRWSRWPSLDSRWPRWLWWGDTSVKCPAGRWRSTSIRRSRPAAAGINN